MPLRRGPTPARPRRTWPQRALISLNAVAVLAAAVTATTLAYSNDRVADVTRTVLPRGVLRGSPDGDSPRPPTEVQNFLIVGVDDASGLPEGDDVKLRETEGRLTDTIMVLRLDPEAVTADLLSFPRDLYVPLAGSSASGRINSAFNVGGPARLIQTIGEDFAIPIDHYVELDFAGFRELVDVVDGVPVQFPHPTRSYSVQDGRAQSSVELDIPEAGCWVLGPRQALGFARARKDYQVREAEGTWHTDLGGDYSRVQRQQLFVQLALRQAISRGARNPNTLRRLVELGARSLNVDADLEPQLVVDLGRAFEGFDPADLVTHTLPVDEAPPGGPAYLYLREAEAEPTLALFRDGGDGATTVRPADVVVRVRNGTATPGQAGEVTRALAAAGFDTVVPDTDVAPGLPTLVAHATGSEGAAHTVARSVAGPVSYQLDPTLEEGLVVLLTGTDWVGVSPTLRPAEDVPAPAPAAGAGTPGGDRAGSPSTTVAAGAGAGTADAPGDPSDPDDPAFFRASEPDPGASCTPTP